MVLCEGISVVVRRSTLETKFNGGLSGFIDSIPNETFCMDPNLTRVGFLDPQETQAFIDELESQGLDFQHRDGSFADIAVVDQQRGLMQPCDWIDDGIMTLDQPTHEVTVARLMGDESYDISMPLGWQYENSLSDSFGFVPTR